MAAMTAGVALVGAMVAASKVEATRAEAVKEVAGRVRVGWAAAMEVVVQEVAMRAA